MKETCRVVATETTMDITVLPESGPRPENPAPVSLKRTGKYAKYHNKPNYRRH